MGKLFRYSLVTLFLLSANLYSDDDGFDDEEEKIEVVSVKEAKDFTAYGSLSLSSNYNYSHDKPTDKKNDFSHNLTFIFLLIITKITYTNII